MNVTLEAIKFNHNARSATTDAFNIRKNETELVAIPEWKRQRSPNFPAAYARDEIGTQTITIQAQFACSDQSIGRIEVQALDGHLHPKPPKPIGAANVLGRVEKNPVVFQRGLSDFVSFNLANVRISDAGVSVSNIAWRWQYSLDLQNWIDLEETEHRIYTVLALPQDPWQPDNPDADLQIPWTEVLDEASGWAAGAQNVDLAAADITRNVNLLGRDKVTYFEKALFIYEGTDNFLCTKFLNLVRQPPGDKVTMNCTDCATVVATFSNILGASLSQSRMGYEFYFNHVQKIGERLPDGGGFALHEVAWKGGCTEADSLFDACLHLDGDADPTRDPFDPLLPVNIRFGGDNREDYHFRFKNQSIGNPCKPDPDSKRHRTIGTKQLRISKTSPTQLQALIDFYHFATWKGTRLSDRHLFFWRSFISGAEISGWQERSIEVFQTVGRMPPTSESLWAPVVGPETLVRLNKYECESLSEAQSFLLKLLGDCDVVYMKREDPRNRTAFGDVAFTNVDGTTILFARGNMVLSSRNVGTSRANLAEFLHLFDVRLVQFPDPEKIVKEMKRFQFRTGEYFVGNEVPLDLIGDDPLRQVEYKFLSASGEVFLSGDQLVYKPELAGYQGVDVFGIDSEQEARKQRLDIVIKSV